MTNQSSDITRAEISKFEYSSGPRMKKSPILLMLPSS